MTISDYFELFTSEQILKDYDLSYDELLGGIVGNGGDGGIDSIYMFVNDTLLHPDYELPDYKKNLSIDLNIIQSKNTNSFSEAAIQKFNDTANDIFDFEKEIDDLTSVYNSELIAQIVNFRETYIKLITKQPKLNVKFFYATKGDEVHPNVERKVINLEKTVTKYFNKAEVEFQFLKAENLLELSRTEKKESYQINVTDSPITTQDGGYICLVNIKDYFEFIKQEDDTINKYIFDANVRDYQGSTVVNKDIFESIKSDTDIDFWWLNNGITIISEKVNYSNKILTIENPQIVNGCQSSFEIFNYYSKSDGAADEKRNLMIRVLETDNDIIRSKVIKSTNSQTIIPLASLRGTDTIHRNIEEYVLPYGFFYERRKNYWKNQKKPVQNIITISSLSQMIMAMLVQRPEISRAKPSSLVKDDLEYNKIFNMTYPLETYYKAILLQSKIELGLKRAETLKKGEGLNIRYFVSLYLTLLNKAKFVKYHVNVEISLDYFNRIDLDNISEEHVDNAIVKVVGIFRELGGTDGVAKAKYFSEKIIENVLETKKNAAQRSVYGK
jgi:hypothetical protein